MESRCGSAAAAPVKILRGQNVREPRSRAPAFRIFGSLAALLIAVACQSYPEVVMRSDFRDGGPGTAPGETGGTGTVIEVPGTSGAGPNVPVEGCGGGAGGACAVQPVCGNGQLDPGEACDDGNSRPGDGCDGVCQVEGRNWSCPIANQPCVPVQPSAVCGNGLIESGEQCDLGPADGGGGNDGQHGCSATCLVIVGWSCPLDGGACSLTGYCGDKTVNPELGEQCDDGTNDGTHGCSSACRTITGWKCPPTGGSCSLDVYCGNGTVDTGEQCDDHNRRSYDGCTSTCFVEPGWICPAGVGACSRICGNGALDALELCDDGNTRSGDGCSSQCKTEPNFTCSTPGAPCVFTPPPPSAQCGNGILESGEACDDGNLKSDDGCSASCQRAPGWVCPTAHQPCVAAGCGDGIVAGLEQCDDGNLVAADGCGPACAIEANANCPAWGGACTPMRCGDGLITGVEQCDDANQRAGDGCSSACQLEPGWRCPVPSVACVPTCGDGLVTGSEQCDEGGDVPCCSATCQLKAGYVCDPGKTPHSQTASLYCPDGTVQARSGAVRGLEQCDDGNATPFDGCSPSCANEPLCGTLDSGSTTPVAYQCFAHCGDGLVMAPEQCDDGNTLDGDGCDQNCKVELIPGTSQPAWTCAQPASGATVSLPVIWRDFTPRTHPQFEINPIAGRRLPGIAQTLLDMVPGSGTGGTRPRYVPVYNSGFKSPTFGSTNSAYNNVPHWTMNGPGWSTGSDTTGLSAAGAATLVPGDADPLKTPAGRYAQWYVDDPTVNQVFVGTIALLQSGSAGSYQYSCDDGGCDSSFPIDPALGGSQPNPLGFFPLDNRGWVAAGQETKRNGSHNYHFTTETRYWFVYRGGERLQFYGDDDVWVFVNGRLALDLGGIHGKLKGYFELNADGTAAACVENTTGQWGAQPPEASSCPTVELGLLAGNVYEVAVFNAERHVTQSNFQLTLRGFNGSPSVCTPICGDGYVVGSEQCDRGSANVDPAGNTYGQCTKECKIGPFCGDGIPQPATEACDNGVNNTSYSKSTDPSVCSPGCQAPGRCGDGILQAKYGESCDEGANNQNTYGHCQTDCQLGPRCGDGTRQTGEACDSGVENGAASSLCGADCQLKCGNGVVDPGEQCDNGPVSGLDGCGADCRRTCGNGQLDLGEECDDGKNDGSYGTCSPDCTLAPYCGDGAKQDPPEACDLGASNAPNAYGPGTCTDQCEPGGICGDGIVDASESCDDGVNSGAPGSCTADCRAYVPPPQCGDGILQGAEQCDDGQANGRSGSRCDTSCRTRCGNAFLEAGEQCDNGVNDGSYGTCNPDCTLANYCGDGKKGGPEQCDEGPTNLPPESAYGVAVCTTSCTWAPFCGDGRIQRQFGEQCEGTLECSGCRASGTVM